MLFESELSLIWLFTATAPSGKFSSRVFAMACHCSTESMIRGIDLGSLYGGNEDGSQLGEN